MENVTVQKFDTVICGVILNSRMKYHWINTCVISSANIFVKDMIPENQQRIVMCVSIPSLFYTIIQKTFSLKHNNRTCIQVTIAHLDFFFWETR